MYLYLYKNHTQKTKDIEANIEEDIDMKNQFRIKNLTDPISIRDAASKIYVDNKFNDHSIIKRNARVDFNDKNHVNVRFIRVNSLTGIPEHVPTEYYVGEAKSNRPRLVRNNQDNDFNSFNLTNMNIITLDTQAVNENHVITKAYVGQFHNDYERSRRDLG